MEGLATLITSNADHLANRIDAATSATTTSTDELTRWIKRLVWATVWLGFAAIGASGMQAYVTFALPPQIITVTKP